MDIDPAHAEEQLEAQAEMARKDFEAKFIRTNPVHGTRPERAAAATALLQLRHFLVAARAEAEGEERPANIRCTVFDRTFAPTNPAAQAEARRLAAQVAMYLGTLVEPALDAAVASMKGSTTYDQRETLTWLERHEGWNS
jgi:hypothetical protein